MKVLIVNGNTGYVGMFRERGWEIAKNFHDKDIDLVQFCGGEDVYPGLYKEDIHPKTFCSLHRDKGETVYYRHARQTGIPMAGICRGGQFLNVMNGGKMWQHVDGHATNNGHKLFDMETGETLTVTSTHHQMMRPHESGDVVGMAKVSSFKEHMSSKCIIRETVATNDIEVVHYENSQCLCFQPHPEFRVGACRTYYFELIKRKFGLEA